MYGNKRLFFSRDNHGSSWTAIGIFLLFHDVVCVVNSGMFRVHIPPLCKTTTECCIIFSQSVQKMPFAETGCEKLLKQSKAIFSKNIEIRENHIF